MFFFKFLNTVEYLYFFSMNILLCSQDTYYMPFLKKAFGQYQLSVSPLPVTAYDKALLETFPDQQAIIFHVREISHVFVDFLREMRIHHPHAVFVVLAHSPSFFFIKECESIPHVSVYTHPFLFHRVVLDLKYSVYLMRKSLENSKEVCVSDLRLDPLTREVSRSGTPIVLRNKEFSLLHFFMENTGRVFSRNDLLEHVWDHNANLMTNTVDVHISQLRKKIDEGRKNPLLRTIYCVGYIFDPQQNQ